MIHTNRCKRCGKPESEHLWEYEYYCNPQSHVDQRKFLDSGLVALDAHKEELFEASKNLAHLHSCEEEGLLSGRPTPQMWREATSKLWDILNQIEKEK